MMPHVNRRQRQRRTMMMMIMMMIMVMPPGQMQPQTVAYYAGYGYESVARDGFGFSPVPAPTTQSPRHGTGPDWCARFFWHIFSDASLNRISFWHCTIIALLMRLTFPPPQPLLLAWTFSMSRQTGPTRSSSLWIIDDDDATQRVAHFCLGLIWILNIFRPFIEINS